MEVTYGKQRFLEILIVLLSTCLVHVAGDCAGLVSTLIADFNSYKTVTTDDYPSPYANSLTCEWKIDSDSAADKVAITYLAFNLETNFDKLKIYDGDSASSRLSYIDTGSLDDRFYISSGRYLFLRFTTDSSVKWSGFKIQYITILGSMIKPNCVDTITLDESSANIERQYALHTFSSPFTSSFYSTCEWTINSTANAQFSINIVYTDFDDFSTYTCDQTTGYGLSIWEDSVIKYQLCDFLPDSLVSMYASGGHTNTVKFRTPIINGVDRGFIITLKYIGTIAVPSSAIPTVASLFSACGSQSNPTRLTVDNVTEQFVISPGYPGQYANNLDCWWILSSSTGIRIRPYHIFIEAADIITIYDGPNSGYVTLASYSGTYSSLSSSVLSTGSSVTIKFETDGSTTDTGFSIGYLENATVVPTCVPTGSVFLNATSNEQSLQSHAGYGSSSYSNYLDSYWLIDTGPPPNTINIKFTSFNIESATSCQYDYVKVYAGACVDEDNRIQFLCGEKTYLYFSSTQGRYILIHFHTDYSVTHSGWELEYYTSDVQTEQDSSEGSNGWKIGLGVGIFILIIFFGGCCKQKTSTKPTKTFPTTTHFQQQPPERKTFPSQIVITARQPKIKPEYIIDTWKRQQKRNLLQKAIDARQVKGTDNVSNGSETKNTSKSESKISNPYKNLPPLQHHIEQRSPPPDYSEFEEKQKEDCVAPPTNTDQIVNQNQDKTYKSDPSLLQIDPNNVPPPFEYIMPPQLMS
ncbi:cubilin-like isoform X2 [Mytilus californianus]|uniref:cubilin-like isoform X2 n=1 Tax=Mytilus californianus TaxID=6549 RepID=UPI002245E57F|nr:cubilin-like isoform X2 [Mytilus californianus]